MGDPAIYVRKIYPACDSLLVRQIFENFPKVVELGLLEVLQQIIAVLQSTSCKQVVSNNIVSTFWHACFKPVGNAFRCQVSSYNVQRSKPIKKEIVPKF